jgi:hypothetical protein
MGKRSAWASQSKLPPSTMMPPIELPWPPMYLVQLDAMTAAPCARGWHRPWAAVLSMISGTPRSRPMSATSLMGNTSSFGLGRVSA